MIKTKSEIETLFDKFIYECTYVLQRRPETIRTYRGVFEPFIKLSGITSLAEINTDHLAHFFETLQTRERVVGRGTIKKGVKNSTIHTYASKLHTFFEWLQTDGHIIENPVHKMPRMSVTYDDIKALKKEEIEKLRAAVEAHSINLLQIKRDRAMLTTFIFTGIRRGEFLGLTLMDIDLQKGILRVRQETSKSKRTRSIPLSHQAIIDLKDYLDERNRRLNAAGKFFYQTPKLFVSLHEDCGFSAHGLKHWVNRLRVHSGVRFHPHQFRHTFAVNVIKSGGSVVELQKLLGHTDLRMTQRYLRSLGVEDLRPVTDRLTFGGLD